MTSCASASTLWPHRKPTTSGVPPDALPTWSASSRALPTSSRLTSAMWSSVCSMNTQMFLAVMCGLADDVFVDQLRNHRRDSFGVGGDGLALRALEDHEVDLVNLGRGAGQADAAFGRADLLGRPDGDLQVVLGEVGIERFVRLELRPLSPDRGVQIGRASCRER